MRQTMTWRLGGALVLFGLAAGLPAQEKAPPKDAEKAARPAPAVLPSGIKLVRNVAYVESGGPRQTLDLYLDQTTTDPLPLLIWVHGGGWQAGSKEGGGPARFLLGKGYHVASINYRLTQQAPFPAQIEDCKAAVRWLRAHAGEYHFDPDHFGGQGQRIWNH